MPERRGRQTALHSRSLNPAPYTALSTDMVRSYDTLVAGLLDNGECGWSLGRGGEGVGVQGALEN